MAKEEKPKIKKDPKMARLLAMKSEPAEPTPVAKSKPAKLESTVKKETQTRGKNK
ncbi:MAG: hypothetical protein HOD85_33945 [Deltaproteobacteria bacterium]|jgi:hypothetical protein|nr:hypothetical protein [Deltaproteobacteria bacterium]